MSLEIRKRNVLRLWPIYLNNDVFLSFPLSVSSFEVKLTSNSPVLIGEPLIINATLVDEDGAPAKGRFCFTWKFKGLTKVKYKHHPYTHPHLFAKDNNKVLSI